MYLTKLPPGGGYNLRDNRTTKNRPKKSTIALFQALENGPLWKGQLVDILLAVNNEDGTYKERSGYLSSTIAWHTGNGRLFRKKKGRYTYFYLTDKGRVYAKERGLF